MVVLIWQEMYMNGLQVFTRKLIIIVFFAAELGTITIATVAVLSVSIHAHFIATNMLVFDVQELYNEKRIM